MGLIKQMRVFCMKEEQICKGLDYVTDFLLSPASLGLGIQPYQCYSSHLGLVPSGSLQDSCQEGIGLSVLMMRANKENLDKQYPNLINFQELRRAELSVELPRV